LALANDLLVAAVGDEDPLDLTQVLWWSLWCPSWLLLTTICSSPARVRRTFPWTFEVVLILALVQLLLCNGRRRV